VQARFLFGIIFFLVWLAPAPGNGGSQLSISTFMGPPLSDTDGTGACDRLLTEAFRRIGIEIEIVHHPAERSISNADRGIDDGDFPRIAGLENRYPGLIRVPEKVLDFEFVVFAQEDFPVGSWDSLAPYHVGIVRGWKILEENLAGVAMLIKARDQEQLFRLLGRNRIDVAVYARREGRYIAARQGLTSVRPLDPPLTVQEMFLYLNRKHARLVSRLAAALREMKQDGAYGRMMQAADEAPQAAGEDK